jgi:hypothetical protein
MSSVEKSQLKAMRRDEVGNLLHGFQMTARHDFGLSSGNPELLRSCGSETMVLEECLLVILDAVWLELNKTLLSRASLSQRSHYIQRPLHRKQS